MNRRPLFIMLGVIAVFALAGPFFAISQDSSKPEQKTPPADRASLTAKRFLDANVRADGSVGDVDPVFREQSLAMFVAAATADRKRVDAIWQYTASNLDRGGNVFALRRNADGQSTEAADGADVLTMAHALLTASERLKDPGYVARADALAAWVLDNSTPATLRFTDVDAFAAHSTDGRWGQARDVIVKRFANAISDDELFVPVGSSGKYDSATQIDLLTFATSCDEADKDVATRVWFALRQSPETRISSALSRTAEVLDSTRSARAAVAASAAAHAAGEQLQSLQLLDKADEIDTSSVSFENTAWTSIGRILITTNWTDRC
jgi:hypothetical protein